MTTVEYLFCSRN